VKIVFSCSLPKVGCLALYTEGTFFYDCHISSPCQTNQRGARELKRRVALLPLAAALSWTSLVTPPLRLLEVLNSANLPLFQSKSSFLLTHLSTTFSCAPFIFNF
jgi:hypothetical protein